MNKKVVIVICIVLVLVVGLFFLFNNKSKEERIELNAIQNEKIINDSEDPFEGDIQMIIENMPKESDLSRY